jgi:hypothetical protein
MMRYLFQMFGMKCIKLIHNVEVMFARILSAWLSICKMDLREIGWECMDWIELAHDRDQWRALVNTVVNLRVP